MSFPLGNAVPRNLRVTCRFHPESRLISDAQTGDVVCSECGLVVGDRIIDTSAEWRNFGEGPDQSRVGLPEEPFFENGDLTTMIGPPEGSRNVSGPTYVRCTVESARNRSLRSAFRSMSEAADRISLPGAVVETAYGVYKEVHEKIKVVGNHKGALGIACLFIASRIEKMPRTFFEICQSSPYSRRQVGKCYKEILGLLDLQDGASDGDEYELVERFCGRLCLPKDLVKLTVHVASEAKEKDLFPNRGPDVVCSAAILAVALASGHDKVQIKDLVRISGASKHGIYQAFRMIATHAAELFPEEFQPTIDWSDLPKMVVV
ncbi:transcription initiation factor IIB-like [Paramacrobiotus metropolitanus]|uniref:transcription initiation factor IIB-like n=1 Tax=Paramacrobiotus metropolitanus TaxID=2943436 RepID=UPI002445B55B|nr:transcription initiation factor IIB-like [Paramacrobiotus metropolitanus]